MCALIEGIHVCTYKSYQITRLITHSKYILEHEQNLHMSLQRKEQTNLSTAEWSSPYANCWDLQC